MSYSYMPNVIYSDTSLPVLPSTTYSPTYGFIDTVVSTTSPLDQYGLSYSPTYGYVPANYGMGSTMAYSPTYGYVNTTLNPIKVATTYTAPYYYNYGLSPVAATVILPGHQGLPRAVDLNNDPKVHKQVTKYIRFKTLDLWLYDDMSDVLHSFKVAGDRVELGNSARLTEAEKEKVVKYIEDNILTERVTENIIKKFIEQTNGNWYDLTKHESFFKDYLHKKLLALVKQ